MKTPRRRANNWVLQIGDRAYPVRSVEHASWLYGKLRDASGEGYSTWPEGFLRKDRRVLYRISYNGNVWKGLVWKAGEIPVIDAVWGPRADATFGD